MSRLITSLWFLDTVPHNTTGDETALNEDKSWRLMSFVTCNHTVVDESSSSINPGLTPENGIKGNYNVINKKQLGNYLMPKTLLFNNSFLLFKGYYLVQTTLQMKKHSTMMKRRKKHLQKINILYKNR
jgi:hypothetical protein